MFCGYIDVDPILSEVLLVKIWLHDNIVQLKFGLTLTTTNTMEKKTKYVLRPIDFKACIVRVEIGAYCSKEKFCATQPQPVIASSTALFFL